ncbi:hypothetical protein DTO96_102383 [Ephemeroptericola cinctiostellae]|uniref:Uncharacterized protein n=1 Tax=Ephemeroptericola cinctiostellae TaxID=2268024 RepID=A0A345DE40_9BURK|nr:hypothetical protein [Ephemeroptericola cinctiostellae]AXF86628.1 hypothetical protein DTO96_102383 [Ephemeroptericola cinctiostellae]
MSDPACCSALLTFVPTAQLVAAQQNNTTSAELHAQAAARLGFVSKDSTVVLSLVPFLRGEKGEAGGVKTAVASHALSGHVAAVYAANGSVAEIDLMDSAHAHSLAGITLNASSVGGVVELIEAGYLTHNGWDFQAGKPVFIGIGGVLTQTPVYPPAAIWRRRIGTALSAETLAVDFQSALFYGEF